MSKDGIEHDASSVDHSQLIQELHRICARVLRESSSNRSKKSTCWRGTRLTFQSRVEAKTSYTNDQVADKSEEEDLVMAISKAAADASVGQINECQIGECIYDFSTVDTRIVVLRRFINWSILH